MNLQNSYIVGVFVQHTGNSQWDLETFTVKTVDEDAAEDSVETMLEAAENVEKFWIVEVLDVTQLGGI